MQALTERKLLADAEREQLVALLERHKGERDSIMLRLMLFTGARSCETLQVRAKDFGECCVTIRAAKGSNDRTIPLPPKFFREIKEYIQANDIKPNDRLFPISTRHFRRIWDVWRPNSQKGSHTLRHTPATLLYIVSRDILAVKSLLGHKQINNTMVYLNFVEGPRALKRKMKGMWNQRIDSEEDGE